MIPTNNKTAVGIGLTGAHRTGKSTIAKIVAERAECPLILSAGQAVADDLGIKVGPGMAMKDRRNYQERVLSAFVQQWDQENGLFVCDRTPLDFAAYAMADYRPEQGVADDYEWLTDYIDRCLTLTRKYFFSVVVVQPGIPYVSAPGKPAPDLVYQEIIAGLVATLAMQVTDGCCVSFVGRGNTDLENRVNFVESQYSQTMHAFIVDGTTRSGVH